MDRTFCQRRASKVFTVTTTDLKETSLSQDDMPVEGPNASLEPCSLERLYSKYGPDKLPSPSSAQPAKPLPSSLVKPIRKSRLIKPLRIPGGRELGDLKKLGCELTKTERVHMLLGMSNTVLKSKPRSRSQPNSAGRNVGFVKVSCHKCCQGYNTETGQTKLKNVKTKLRLVTTRNVTEGEQSQDHHSSPEQSSNQNVVPLPLLPCHHQFKAASIEDIAALREARRSLRHMLFPLALTNRPAAAVLNFRFAGGSQPSLTREYIDSSEATSSRFLTSAAPPVSSILEDHCDSETVSSYDADRVDSEQFDYVFERFSVLSTESEDTTVTPESDTATFSARAQRPSTTDTVESPQHAIDTRISPNSTQSPMSCRQKSRGHKDTWPPQFTVVPSWPSLDDPFRFQYLGRGVHRDIMRRLHKSRCRKRKGKHGNPEENESDQQQQQEEKQQQKLPQKLEVIVPSHTTCDTQDV